jgi:proteic killer suppression protein
MILSYWDIDTENVHRGRISRKFQVVAATARRKLDALEAAQYFTDMRNPPGNRLEKLAGERAEQYSIRINDQYRICFDWRERIVSLNGLPAMGDAANVEITDYR